METMKMTQVQVTNLNNPIEKLGAPTEKKSKKLTESDFDIEMDQVGMAVQQMKVAAPEPSKVAFEPEPGKVAFEPISSHDLQTHEERPEGLSLIQENPKAGENTAATWTGPKAASSLPRNNSKGLEVTEEQSLPEFSKISHIDEKKQEEKGGHDLLEQSKQVDSEQNNVKYFPNVRQAKTDRSVKTEKSQQPNGLKVGAAAGKMEVPLNYFESESESELQPVGYSRQPVLLSQGQKVFNERDNDQGLNQRVAISPVQLSGGEFLNTLKLARGDRNLSFDSRGNSSRLSKIVTPKEGLPLDENQDLKQNQAQSLKQDLVLDFGLNEGKVDGVRNQVVAEPLKRMRQSHLGGQLSTGVDPSLSALTTTSLSVPKGTDPASQLNLKNEISAQVVQGSMAQRRVSTDGLVNIGNGVRYLTSQGGGEFRVRLKPDHMGELSIRVVTEGNRVGLKIQASDEGAKKILEDSLSSLKDNLLAQNLSLGQVEFTVAKSEPASEPRQSQFSSGFQDGIGYDKNQDQQQNSSRQWSRSDNFNEDLKPQNRMGGRVPFAQIQSLNSKLKTTTEGGRLDLKV